MKFLFFTFLLIPILSFGQWTHKEKEEFKRAFEESDSSFIARGKMELVSMKLAAKGVDLVSEWNKYIQDCKNPYYKDTVVVCYNSGHLISKLLYVKIWITPNWSDFWDKYLKETGKIKFE